MKSKKWLRIYIFVSATGLIGALVFNYLLDSYAVFRDDFTQLYREPNQNYLKVQFLLENKDSYDSFIFGSSRVGKINPEYIPSGKFYNMTYSEGVPKEHLENIKLLLDNNIKIKNILMGLDEFSYEIDPYGHVPQLLRRPHYQTEINSQSEFEFFFKYLAVRPSAFDTMRLFKEYFLGEVYDTFEFDICNTGVPIVPKEVDNEIEVNPQLHIQDKKFEAPIHFQGNRIKQTLDEIKEIIKLSKEHNFNLIIFFNPVHKTTYLDTNFDNFQNFKEKLVKLTPFYDFSGLNFITTNNYYYYDTSHYRTIVGDMIIDKIYRKKTFESPDFGRYINRQNISAHLEALGAELNQSYKAADQNLKKTLFKQKG